MEGFVGEIRLFGFDYTPEEWLPCDGRSLSVREYPLLFTVISTRYGGDDVTFKLPDLRGPDISTGSAGLAAVGTGQTPGGPTRELGKVYGQPVVYLRMAEIPAHTHQLIRPGGSKPYLKKTSYPTNRSALGTLAQADNTTLHALTHKDTPNSKLISSAVTSVGQGGPHENRQPYQVVTFAICVSGVWPSRQ